MRILWIGKEPGGGDGGDEIYDRKLVAAVRAHGHQVDLLHPRRLSRAREVMNLALGLPYYRARYHDDAFVAHAREAARTADAVVCSWEPFDSIAFALEGPVLPILHNVTSTALSAMYPGSSWVGGLAAGARRWEQRAYGSGRFSRIAVLSRADQAHLARLRRPETVINLAPGMPPVQRPHPDWRFRRELVLTGTYAWRPKRRDLDLFLAEFAAADLRMPLYSAEPAPSAGPDIRPLADLGDRPAFRIGLVTDRFEAGYKLKAAAYVAAGCVVASYCDVGAEFRGLPHADLFVRRIGRAQDLARLADELAAVDPHRLASRFHVFQTAAAAAFSWQATAGRLLDALGTMAARSLAPTAG
jgi:hypothetical protein